MAIAESANYLELGFEKVLEGVEDQFMIVCQDYSYSLHIAS
jgi:hypothetical protein